MANIMDTKFGTYVPIRQSGWGHHVKRDDSSEPGAPSRTPSPDLHSSQEDEAQPGLPMDYAINVDLTALQGEQDPETKGTNMSSSRASSGGVPEQVLIDVNHAPPTDAPIGTQVVSGGVDRSASPVLAPPGGVPVAPVAPVAPGVPGVPGAPVARLTLSGAINCMGTLGCLGVVAWIGTMAVRSVQNSTGCGYREIANGYNMTEINGLPREVISDADARAQLEQDSRGGYEFLTKFHEICVAALHDAEKAYYNATSVKTPEEPS